MRTLNQALKKKRLIKFALHDHPIARLLEGDKAARRIVVTHIMSYSDTGLYITRRKTRVGGHLLLWINDCDEYNMKGKGGDASQYQTEARRYCNSMRKAFIFSYPNRMQLL